MIYNKKDIENIINKLIRITKEKKVHWRRNEDNRFIISKNNREIKLYTYEMKKLKNCMMW